MNRVILLIVTISLIVIIGCGSKSLVIKDDIKGGFDFVKVEKPSLEGDKAKGVLQAEVAHYEKGYYQPEVWVAEYEPVTLKEKQELQSKEEKQQYGNYWVFGNEKLRSKIWWSGNFVIMVDTVNLPEAQYIVQKYLERYPSDVTSG